MLNSLRIQQIVLFFVIACFGIYVWAVLRYTVNMPYWDDYEAILNFLNNYVNSSFFEKLKLIFSQHNEHRIVFNRLIEIAQYKLFGEVNFLYLIIIGNFGWGLVILLLWNYTKKSSCSLLLFTPVIFFMLTFVHFELMTWAMASLQQYYQILFSLLAIYFMVTNKAISSYLFMIVSIFTGGGGIVLVPLFALFALVNKDFKKLLWILLVGGLTLALYFVILEYHKPGHHPSILKVLLDPFLFFSYALVFMGNIGKIKIVSMLIGFLSLASFAFISKQTYQKNSFLFWSIAFIVATSFLTALARAGFGVEQGLDSRYSIYSVLLVSLVYLSYALLYKNKMIYLLGYIFGLISFMFWLFYGINWLSTQSLRAKNEIMYPVIEHAESILKKSAQLKVFSSWQGIKLPSTLLDLPKKEGQNIYCFGIAKQIDVCNGDVKKYHLQNSTDLKINASKSMKTISLEGWTVDSLSNNSSCGVVVSLGDKKKFFKLNSRLDVAQALNNQRYEVSGFDGTIEISNLEEGLHLLEIRTLDSSCTGYYETLKVPLIIEDIHLDKIEKLPVVDIGFKGYIDIVNNQRFDNHLSDLVIKDDKLIISGWFIDEKNTALAKAVMIDINNKKYLANYGLSRPDVANALKNDRYNNSGFSIEISTKELSNKQNTLSIFLLSDDGKYLYETNGKFDFTIEGKK